MPEAFDRCVRHVKGKVKNPYAVCNAAGAGKGGKKKAGQRQKPKAKRAR